jgi:hypothetical protein
MHRRETCTGKHIRKYTHVGTHTGIYIHWETYKHRATHMYKGTHMHGGKFTGDAHPEMHAWGMHTWGCPQGHMYRRNTHRKYAQENIYVWGDIYMRDTYV